MSKKLVIAEKPSVAADIARALGGFGDEPDLHVMLNMDGSELEFELPVVPGRRWHRAVDTGLAAPDDIAEPGREQAISGASYGVNGHSVVVLLSR